MMSNAVCNVLNIDKLIKAKDLNQEQITKIEGVLAAPSKYSFPAWMLNRRKDIDTGEDKHLIGTDVRITKEFDVKRMQKTKSYKGLRHAWGLPVRGQRTRSHFHKGGAVIGVKKKAARMAEAASGKPTKESKEKK